MSDDPDDRERSFLEQFAEQHREMMEHNYLVELRNWAILEIPDGVEPKRLESALKMLDDEQEEEWLDEHPEAADRLHEHRKKRADAARDALDALRMMFESTYAREEEGGR